MSDSIMLHTYTVTVNDSVASVSIADQYINRPEVIQRMIVRLLQELAIQNVCLSDNLKVFNVDYSKGPIQAADRSY